MTTGPCQTAVSGKGQAALCTSPNQPPLSNFAPTVLHHVFLWKILLSDLQFLFFFLFFFVFLKHLAWFYDAVSGLIVSVSVSLSLPSPRSPHLSYPPSLPFGPLLFQFIYVGKTLD